MDNNVQINQFIPGQFPQVYKGSGPNFIAFMKAYYEWLEQSGNALWYSRNFSNLLDIDKSLNDFIFHFKNTYMANLPGTMVANQRLLIKHITDLYSARGSQRGYELLFRILFDEDIQVYLPSTNIFKLSDNSWGQQGYIEVTDSDFLASLVGTAIYSSTTGATALVEDHNILHVNGKVINVLHISNVNGSFRFGEQILSNEVPAITGSNAPFIRGSLTSVSIDNGGVFFNVGDVVNIIGSGAGALGHVASVTYQRGKVIFDLIDGGYGFTTSPIITVAGDGDGATFQVGSITDQTIYTVNVDQMSDYYNVILDGSAGFNLTLSSLTGVFTIGETVTAAANGIGLDFTYLSGSAMVNGEVLSNTSLGISSLAIVNIDEPNFVNCTGPESALNNANLVGGAILVSSISAAQIYINSVLPKTQYNATGKYAATVGSIATVQNSTGYFLPTSKLIGGTSHANAIITKTERNSNWGFPVPFPVNLDTSFEDALSYTDLTIGKISRLVRENPGDNYSSNATVSIYEPLIYQLQIPDGDGGFWGGDANVTATASNANGIMTAVHIIDSGFGFVPGERVSITSNNNYSATGHAITDGVGMAQGQWKDRKSFVSDQNFLQDSYYYQQFSYEVIAPRAIETYEKFVKDIVHPVGYQLFGRIKINDTQNSSSKLHYNRTIQSFDSGTSTTSVLTE